MGAVPGSACWTYSGAADVHRLQALVAFGNREYDTLALAERAVALALDRAEVDENIIAVFARDKAEALGGIEPFHGPDFLSRTDLFDTLAAGTQFHGEEAGQENTDEQACPQRGLVHCHQGGYALHDA